MDAVKYMNKKKKMCSYYTSGEGCSKCPLFQICSSPYEMSKEGIKLSVQIVRKWRKKNENRCL